MSLKTAAPVDSNNDVDSDDTTGDDAGNDPQLSDRATDDSGLLTINFLGAPALGKDSTTNDRNTIIDDFMQCTLGDDDKAESETANAEGNTANCIPDVANDGLDDDRVDDGDTSESRSKLVVITPVGTGTNAPSALTTPVIDGGSEDHLISGNQSSATVYTVIQDADESPLKDVLVTYTVTSEPPRIASSVLTFISAVPTDDPDIVGIFADDTIVMRTISGLPTKEPFKVTVKVTAGQTNPLTVGTIVIQRAGDLAMVTAQACVEIPVDKEDADLMDGCMEGYDPKMRYGTGDPVTIHAEATDKIGVMVTDATTTVTPGTKASWWDSLSCMEMNDAVMPMGDEPAVGPDDMTSPYCKDVRRPVGRRC